MTEDAKQRAHDLLTNPRGNYLIAEAFHFYMENGPDTSNRDDMAFMLENLWPQHLEIFEKKKT